MKEINFEEGFESKEKAEKVVKQIQFAIDELTLANQESMRQLKETLATIDQAEKQIKILTQANIDMTKTMKNLHIVLGTKKDLWKDDEEMNVVMNALAHFVTGSGAIKLGVIGNEENKDG